MARRREHCEVVTDACIDPAGWGISGLGVAKNANPATCVRPGDECYQCGNLMCTACRAADKLFVCADCDRRDR